MVLLATKLSVPPARVRTVTRKILEEELEKGLEGKLILVSAPAGFGKTTLVTSWVRRKHAAETAWLTLDESDNDPVRFWSYFATALQKLMPKVGEEMLSMLKSSPALAPQAALSSFINEVTARQEASSPILLVLDDFQLIHSEAILTALTFLLEHMPEQLKLVLLSRSDSELPLARLRTRGQLTEMRMKDLRFSAGEAAEFLNRSMGLNLSEKGVKTLEKRTEGWIAGLQMAAISMRGLEDVQAFIEAFSGSHRYVLDYLLDEVLNRQPAEVQDFLFKTAILTRLCGPLCDALTGRSDGQAMLKQLENANLFLIALDHERQWYRYHPLFADLLTRELQKRSAGLLPQLHQNAFVWHREYGNIAEAIRHAFAAQNFDAAADLIEKAVFDLLARSEINTLLDWLHALPEETVRVRPWLCVMDAHALLLVGQAERIEARLLEAEEGLSRIKDLQSVSRLQGYIAAIRAQMAFIMGAAPEAIEYARAALEGLGPEDSGLLATTATILGAAYSYNANFPAAYQAFERAKAISLASGNHFNAGLASSALAQLCLVQGQLQRAYQIYRDSIKQIERNTSTEFSPGMGYIYVGLADVLREWNDLEQAMLYAQKGLELCKLLGQAEILMSAYVVLARIQRAKAETDQALLTLEEARLVASEMSTWSLETVTSLQARLWLDRNDLAAALDWVKQANLDINDPLSFNRETAYLTLVRVLMAEKKRPQAAALLERLLLLAQKEERTGSLIEIGLLTAINRFEPGESQAALKEFLTVLDLAREEGFRRIFLDEGRQARALLTHLRPELSAEQQDFINELYEHRPAGEVPGLIEPLSERELEILVLLAGGRTNPEIAGELVISLNTVKTHVKSIYLKLGVHKRSQALLRAQELEIL